MKYKYNNQWKDLTVKAGDTLPIGTIVDYDGDTVPTGYEQVNSYSTDEIKTGDTWIDGKPIYRKVLIIPKSSMQSDVQFPVTHGITNLDMLVEPPRGISKNTNDMDIVPWYSGGTYRIAINDINSTSIFFNISGNAYSKIQTIYLLLEYTKTTD